jgi:hypothetical protein
MLASTTATMSPCDLSYPLVGDGSACHPNPTTGQLTLAQCQALCPPTMLFPGSVLDCWLVHGTPTTLTCNYGPCGTGRRPEGLAPPEVDARFAGAADPTARYLAEMAWLEAASVPAFERLTRELEAHGAPRRLLDASRRAVAEEVRHARTMGALATRAGARVGEPTVDVRAVRSLEDIAIENAVEGCVRETFGAVVAAVQARRARDARFRTAMKGIARDEARHARLSWDVAKWLDDRLDEDARRRVRAARDRAAEELFREAGVEPDAALASRFGVPTSGEGRAMVEALRTSLWS